jgi:hypothetical protein
LTDENVKDQSDDQEEKSKIVFRSRLNKIEINKEIIKEENSTRIKTLIDNKKVSKKSFSVKKKENEENKKCLIRSLEKEFDDIKIKKKNSDNLKTKNEPIQIVKAKENKNEPIQIVRAKENKNEPIQIEAKGSNIVSIPLNIQPKTPVEEVELSNCRNKADTLIESTLQNCFNPVNNNLFILGFS